MSSLKKIEPKQPRTRDIQKQITKIMLRRNPKCTVAQVARNYEAMKNYLMGEVG